MPYLENIMELDKIFDELAENLAEFEKDWKSERGLNCLKKAVEIYQEISNSKHESENKTRGRNLFKRYGLFCENKAKAIFYSNDIESNEFLSFNFLKILKDITGLFEEVQVFGTNEGEFLRKNYLHSLIFALLCLGIQGGSSELSIDEIRSIVLKIPA